MTRARRLLSPALLAASLASCGHAPVGPDRAPFTAAAFPPPPSPTRARLVAILPDPAAPAPTRKWWEAAFEWITGGKVERGRRIDLQRPFGVSVTPDGAVVVADPDSGSVIRFRAGRPPERIRCRATEWSSPMAVALDERGTLYVADAGLAVVARVHEEDCTLLGAGALERPTGIALTPEGILVADPPRHQVVVLDEQGRVAARWGRQGTDEGSFAFPTSVALGAGGEVFVTDALNFRVARLDREGRWAGAFGEPGETGAGFARPKGIAVGPSGRVYVSDAQRDVVLVFHGSGELDYAIGGAGEEPGDFALPSGLALAGDRLYVADSHNRRVQVFEIVGGAP